jgi:hypothetical protein
MTPDELRSLASEATPGPWVTGTGAVGDYEYPNVWPTAYGAPVVSLDRRTGVPRERLDADARLIALAPSLALLCAELGEALRRYMEAIEGSNYIRIEPSYEPLRTAIHAGDAALAKLEELEATHVVT